MKKILMICICGGFMSLGATVSGYADCVVNGVTVLDGLYLDINCTIDNAKTCKAYCNNGTAISGATECRPGFYRLHKIATDLYEKCGDEQAACTDDQDQGAKWNSFDGCYCTDPQKGWNKQTGHCEETEDFKACRKAEEQNKAVWNIDGYCKCTEKDYEWNSTNHQCEKKYSQKRCEALAAGNRGDLQGKVKWQDGKCICLVDPDGNTITNPDEWEIDKNGFKCVKTDEAQRYENKSRANDKNQEIKNIITELNGIAEDFEKNHWKKSHWKNADGGFNTARLASDSIAGVVLGTVGGVITSNVIKKNQIKGGFEDINCVIGGQRVAGYADDFNVGIQ